MVDFNPAAAEVIPGSDAITEDIVAGEVLAAGDPYYFDATDSDKAKKADANASDATAKVRGLVVSQALAAGQRGVGQRAGSLTIGATAAIGAGAVVVLSATAGKLAPVADLAAGWRRTIIGVGKAANGLLLAINPTGVTP